MLSTVCLSGDKKNLSTNILLQYWFVIFVQKDFTTNNQGLFAVHVLIYRCNETVNIGEKQIGSPSLKGLGFYEPMLDLWTALEIKPNTALTFIKSILETLRMLSCSF